MKMLKGGIIEEYLNKARKLKNQLDALKELIFDYTLIQTVLNDLPKPYKYIISTITNGVVFLTFNRISVAVLIRHHKLQHQNSYLKDKKKLLIHFFKRVHITLKKKKGLI